MRSNRVTAILAAAVIAVAIAPSAAAQLPAPDEYVRMLLPIVVRDAPGAFGSVWSSTLVIHNRSAHELRYYPGAYSDCGFGVCPIPPILRYLRPGAVAEADLMTFPDNQPPAIFLYVDKLAELDAGFALRVRDLSRQLNTFGTEIPVVRESDLLTGAISLPLAPLTGAFRQTIRIYDFDSQPSVSFRLRVVDENGAPISEIILATTSHQRDPQLEPGYVQLSVEDHAFAPDTTPKALEITPLAPVRYWAMVSVTHNETQHVTTVTPQK
jgi:hypothetical protein